MSEAACGDPLAGLRQRGDDPGRLLDAPGCPPGAPFPARDGRSCAAHAASIGATGYCHWHDPALGLERAAWAEGRKGARRLRRFARIAPEACHAIPVQGAVHPALDDASLPPLDLAGIPDGQRRVIVALLAEPVGRTYPATAAALGLHLGTVHRHLARLRERHPRVYANVMAHRAAQLTTGQERTAQATKGRRAQRRAAHRARYGARETQKP